MNNMRFRSVRKNEKGECMKTSTTEKRTKSGKRAATFFTAIVLAMIFSFAPIGEGALTTSVTASAATGYSYAWSNYPSDLYAHNYGAKIAYTGELTYNDDITGYFLFDIDGNGIPELIYRTGSCEADYMYYVYTYNDGTCFVGSFSGSHVAFYDTAPNEAGGLALGRSIQGYASFYTFSLEPDYSYNYPKYTLYAYIHYEDRYVSNIYDPFGLANSDAREITLHDSSDLTYLNQYFAAYGV